MPPSAPRAIASSASSSIVMFSAVQMWRKRSTIKGVWMRRRSKRWQREMMVGRILSPSVVAK